MEFKPGTSFPSTQDTVSSQQSIRSPGSARQRYTFASDPSVRPHGVRAFLACFRVPFDATVNLHYHQLLDLVPVGLSRAIPHKVNEPQYLAPVPTAAEQLPSPQPETRWNTASPILYSTDRSMRSVPPSMHQSATPHCLAPATSDPGPGRTHTSKHTKVLAVTFGPQSLISSTSPLCRHTCDWFPEGTSLGLLSGGRP